MPTQQITTQVTSQRAKQLVSTVVSAFQDIRDAQEAVEDAQTGALYARYEWGRDVYSALQQAEQGDEMAEEIGRRLDYSAAWVRHHARFAARVTDEFPGFDPPVAGYVADCLDQDRSLAWRSAVRWMSSNNGPAEDEETTEFERKRRDVERKLEAVEEAAEELSEAYLDTGDTLDEDERRAVEGVLTRAKQAIEDNRHLADTLEDEAPERVECKPYTLFIKDHACRGCGLDGDDIVPHHYRPAEPTGASSKPDDWFTLPACFQCHQKIEDGDEEAFWAERPVDPMEEIARLQAEFLTKIVEN